MRSLACKTTNPSVCVVTYRGTIYPWQCDHMGHMNVMWYIGKFDEASWQLLSMLGLTRSRFRREGVGMAAIEQRIEYKRELYAGDIVTIRSGVLEVREKTVRLIHEMWNDETGDLVANAVILGIHIDATSRKARLLPVDVRKRVVGMVPSEVGSDAEGSDSKLEAAARWSKCIKTAPGTRCCARHNVQRFCWERAGSQD